MMNNPSSGSGSINNVIDVPNNLNLNLKAQSQSQSRSRNLVSDFSSQEYWSTRFSTETKFEWLLPSSKIIPFVLDHISPPPPGSPSGDGYRRSRVRGLHIGCGTSSLGRDIEQASREESDKMATGVEVDIIDADYVADSIQQESNIIDNPDSDTECVTEPRDRILSLDCLSLDDLRSKSPDEGGWDFILDKSTADAISCGPLIPSSSGVPSVGEDAIQLEPLEILLRNLASVTRQEGVWISVSYSPTRFYVPYLEASGWEVRERRFLASTSLPEGRRVRDKSGVERVVWEPETGVWGWVLRRT